MIIVETIINRPPAEVFRYYINPGNRPKWSDHVLAGQWLTDGPAGVGSVFRITLRQWGRKLQTDRRITAYEPDRRMCYVLDSGYVHVTSCQTFDPTGEDGTCFTIQADIQYRGLVRLLAPLLNQPRHLRDEADNLKRALALPA